MREVCHYFIFAPAPEQRCANGTVPDTRNHRFSYAIAGLIEAHRNGPTVSTLLFDKCDFLQGNPRSILTRWIWARDGFGIFTLTL